MVDHFEFKTEGRVRAQRFEAIMPAWETLLEQLGLPIESSHSEINTFAVDETYEAKVAELLDEMYQRVSTFESPEEQREFVSAHEPLQLALLRARKILSLRSNQ